jgi:hypothetical protein
MVKKASKEKVKLIYLGPHQVGLPSGTLLDEMPKCATENMKLLTVSLADAQKVSKQIGSAGSQYSDAYKKIVEEARHV